MSYDRNVSPVGWYVGAYVIRFTERADKRKHDLENRFLTWENWVLVKARSIDAAYDKVVKIAKGDTKPYKGGPDGIAVQWIFEGVTELLPVYEQIEDGSEIMWAERTAKLKNIRKRVKKKAEFHQ